MAEDDYFYTHIVPFKFADLILILFFNSKTKNLPIV